ncbi:hypothetical protein FQA39_LY14317 [Lamprigera yunnana]|nr:hypothetical protein FQA39_LY14317 [Lamprigera yunnana]
MQSEDLPWSWSQIPDYNPAEEARLLQYNNASNEVLVDVTRYALDGDADRYIKMDGDRLLEVGIPFGETDATNKAFVDSIIRDRETRIRTYMDMLARDGETAMRTHYTAYFDNTNAEMRKIVEKINIVHYAVEGDINGIIANIIPSVVKMMLLERVRENDMLIADL